MTEIGWPTTMGTHLINLLEGEWIQDPRSTKRRIIGPCLVAFDIYPDGGMAAYVKETKPEAGKQ